jgi:phage antirepressor YoqD-like protein
MNAPTKLKVAIHTGRMPVPDLIAAGTTMTSREIADLCEKDHKHVLSDIRSMLEQLGMTSVGFSANLFDSYGRLQTAFDLPKDLTLTLVSGYNVVLRKRIIDRWLELEETHAIRVPTTLAGALRLAAEQAEQIEVQAAQLTAAKSAVEFVEKYVDATGSLSFRQVCKVLDANENHFRAFLLDRSIWYRLGREWVPHSQHIDAGRCEVKTDVSGINKHAFNSARFTTKGMKWIAGEWAKHQLVARQVGAATK